MKFPLEYQIWLYDFRREIESVAMTQDICKDVSFLCDFRASMFPTSLIFVHLCVQDDMYDIAGEISPGYRRRNNFASRDDMGELEEDDDKDDEGVVEMRARPVKGSARPESAAGSGPKVRLIPNSLFDNSTLRAVIQAFIRHGTTAASAIT